MTASNLRGRSLGLMMALAAGWAVVQTWNMEAETRTLATGYQERVGQYVAAGLIEYDQALGHLRLKPLHDGIGATDLLREAHAFAAQSPLRNDLREPRLWEIEGGVVVRLDEAARVRFAARRTPAWNNGARLAADQFLNPPVVELRSLRTDTVTRSTFGSQSSLLKLWATPPSEAPGPTGTARGWRISITEGSAPSAAAVEVATVSATPVDDKNRRRVGFTLTRARTAPALTIGINLKALDRGGSIRLHDGDEVFVRPSGETGTVYAFAALDRDLVGVSRRDNDTARARTGLAAFDRVLSPTLGRTATMMGYHPRLNPAIDLTLNGDIQRHLDRQLAAAFESLTQGGGNGETLAAVVMNAQSGDVLALASHEAEDGNAATRRLAPVVPPALRLLPVGSANKPLIAAALVANEPELQRFTVGPVCPGGSGCLANDVLGTPLSAPLNDVRNYGEVVSLSRFLEVSDNYYAASLMNIGFGRTGGSEDRGPCSIPTAKGVFVPDGCPAGFRRSSKLEIPGQARFLPDEALGAAAAGHPAMRKLEMMFDIRPAAFETISPIGAAPARETVRTCVAAFGTRRVFGTDQSDISVWTGWIGNRSKQTGKKVADPAACTLADASPQRSNFKIHAAVDFRQQLATIMLGNGEGQWSAVGLAQAYSRLVMGTIVYANFVTGASHSGLSGSDEDIALEKGWLETARRLLGNGLSRVVTGQGGTARALLPDVVTLAQEVAVEGRYRLGVFGKTGTPEVLLREPTALSRAINAMIGSGHLVALPVDTDVYKQATTRLTLVGDPSFGTGALTVQETGTAALARALRDIQARSLASDVSADVAGIKPDALAAQLKALSRSCEGQADQACPLVYRHRRLVSYRPPVKTVDKTGEGSPNGKVMALVLALYPNRPGLTVDAGTGLVTDFSKPPALAWTVVVNVQADTSDNKDIHLDLVRRVLAGPLRCHLVHAGQGVARLRAQCQAQRRLQAPLPAVKQPKTVKGGVRDKVAVK